MSWCAGNPSSPPKAQTDGYEHLEVAMEEAIQNGNPDTLEDILHILASVDSTWIQTALCLSLDYEQLTCVELLVDPHAMLRVKWDPEEAEAQETDFGFKKFGVAMALSNVCQDMVQMNKLLEWAIRSGMKVSESYAELNGSLMHFAASEDNAKLISVLYKHGLDPFCKNKRGNSPMHEAVRLCNAEAVKALLNTCGSSHHKDHSQDSHSSDGDSPNLVQCDFLNALNDIEESPLNIAVTMSWKYILQILCSHGADLNTYVGNYTALHRAIMEEDCDCVRTLLEHGANACLRTRCEMRCTPLIIAVQMKQISTVKLLMQRPCAFDAFDAINGLTAIHFTIIQDGGSDCFKQMVDHGIDVNVRAEDGRTALMFAVSYDRHDCLCRLLRTPGCDVNLVDRQWGMTALHRAADLGCYLCTLQLLEAGADPDIKDIDQVSSLLLAVNSHNITVVKQLLKWGSRTNDPQPLTISLERNYVEIVRALVLATLDLTPIKTYISTRHYEMIALSFTSYCSWLGELVTNPRPLRDLTRLVIRQAIGWNLPNKLASLPLPNELKDFVLIPQLSHGNKVYEDLFDT